MKLIGMLITVANAVSATDSLNACFFIVDRAFLARGISQTLKNHPRQGVVDSSESGLALTY